jgi:hypothetical protein
MNRAESCNAADRMLGLLVRIPPVSWMSVACECCVLSGRVLCDGPITRPEESYRLWCVIGCDLEIPKMRETWPVLGCCAIQKKKSWFEGNQLGGLCVDSSIIIILKRNFKKYSLKIWSTFIWHSIGNSGRPAGCCAMNGGEFLEKMTDY